MSEFSVRPDWMAFCLPDISEAEVQADADVIRSGWWAKGPRTMEFQKKTRLTKYHSGFCKQTVTFVT